MLHMGQMAKERGFAFQEDTLAVLLFSRDMPADVLGHFSNSLHRKLSALNTWYRWRFNYRISWNSIMEIQICMTDSTTQSASPPVKIYHGSEIIPVGRRFEPKPNFFFWGVARTAEFFCELREHFPPREKKHPPMWKKNPPLVQPATTISRFVWAKTV